MTEFIVQVECSLRIEKEHDYEAGEEVCEMLRDILSNPHLTAFHLILSE